MKTLFGEIPDNFSHAPTALPVKPGKSGWMSFCELLESRRQGLGLTLAEVAEKIGVPASTMSFVQHGKRRLPPKYLPKLAEVLRLPYEDVKHAWVQSEWNKAYQAILAEVP